MSQKVQTVIANPFLCIGSPSLYMAPTVYIFPEKELNKMVLFIVNVGHEEVKIIKGHSLPYFTLSQYDNLTDARENQESVIVNILVATSETKIEILPAIPENSKMIFPHDHTPLRKVLLQDAGCRRAKNCMVCYMLLKIYIHYQMIKSIQN